MTQTGTTTTHLNLRAGPGTNFDILVLLPPSTPVTVLETQGDWHCVQALGRQGFVHRAFVTLTEQTVAEGLVSTNPDAAGDGPANVPLPPPESQRIVTGPQATA